MKNDNEIEFAKFCFENKHYDKAKELFLNNDMLYEAGFSSLLTGNSNSAKLIWKEIKDPCLATDWGLIILDIIEGKPYTKAPKYFQTRAFLETYINLFLENELYDWTDNIINAYKFFTRSNNEVPKFIARVLSVWGYWELVYEFSALAKRICYYDPEIHFIEAESYLIEGNYKLAYKSVIEGIKIAPNYYPNKKLLNMIKETGYRE